MNNTIIDFKSNEENFYVEANDLKNNTVRKIDLNDQRFRDLIRAWKRDNDDFYPFIRITHSDFAYAEENKASLTQEKQYSFIRRIKHIALFEDYLVITWEMKK